MRFEKNSRESLNQGTARAFPIGTGDRLGRFNDRDPFREARHFPRATRERTKDQPTDRPAILENVGSLAKVSPTKRKPYRGVCGVRSSAAYQAALANAQSRAAQACDYTQNTCVFFRSFPAGVTIRVRSG